MRTWSIVTLSFVSACSFRVPRGIPVRVSGKAQVRANVNVRVTAQGSAPVDTVVVPLQNAPVTEFFGIPLADAREVVFVLDISGSMSEPAEGQLAMIRLPPPPPPPPDATQAAPPATNELPPVPTPPPATNAPPGGPPPPPPPPSPDTPPQPMGYPSGYPPPSSVPPATQPTQQQPDTQVAASFPTKLEVAQAELIDAIAKLPAGTRMNLLIFSNDVDAYAPDLVVIDEARRADLIGFVREMQANGATALQPAMRITYLLNAPRIVLLSDGLGNIGGGPDDIMRDTREALRGGVRIDTIGIGRGQDTKLLTALAGESGGLYQRF